MVVGIVAEYNPFHNGHKLQIEYAKNVLGASHVIVAMSGSFTQRGTIACFDKYTRAEAALKCGADIVLEIPTIFATSSAKEFASAGVELLASTGIVDTLLFGAECDNLDLFIKSGSQLAQLEKNGSLDSTINSFMSEGLTYAEARATALDRYIPSQILSSPNNILGLEYCRYIYTSGTDMDIAVIKRQSNDYNSKELTGDISSASAIRENISKTGQILAVPFKAKSLYKTSTFINQDDISDILHYRLLSQNDYEKYLDCTLDLADRIRNNLNEYLSFSQFCNLLKTKNINYSRISRVLCHILLGITQDDFHELKEKGYISYLRMLGFSKNGKSLLSQIKEKGTYTLLTRPTDDVNKFDIISSDILRLVLTKKIGTVLPTEYTRRFNLNNI